MKKRHTEKENGQRARASRKEEPQDGQHKKGKHVCLACTQNTN